MMNLEILKYENDPKYVYKSCYDYVVILEKLDNTIITNENRISVSKEYKQYAKYRGNKFMVKDIINKFDSNKKITSIANSVHSSTISYDIGKIITVTDFDNDIENVCSSGIHYFLKPECAFHYMLDVSMPNDYTGEHLEWFESGKPLTKKNYKNGKLEGKCLRWYKSGQLQYEENYKNDRLEGKYTHWYESGQLHIEGYCVNGYFNGEYLEWYESGQLHNEHYYVNGNFQGKYLKWYESGQLHYEQNYVNGNLEGKSLEWYESGKLHIKSNYVNGQLNGEYMRWYESGQLHIEGYYVNGDLEGKYLEWYESGEAKIINENYILAGISLILIPVTLFIISSMAKK